MDAPTLTFLDRAALLYWLALAFLACGALWFAVGALREIGRGAWLALRLLRRAPCDVSCVATAKQEARRAKHGLPRYAAFQSKIVNPKS